MWISSLSVEIFSAMLKGGFSFLDGPICCLDRWTEVLGQHIWSLCIQDGVFLFMQGMSELFGQLEHVWVFCWK